MEYAEIYDPIVQQANYQIQKDFTFYIGLARPLLCIMTLKLVLVNFQETVIFK